MSEDSVFARRLREIRLAAGTTQKQLADRMTAAGTKMYRSTVAKIEAGDQPASIAQAIQFANVLGIPLAELVTDDHADHRFVEAQLAVRALEYEVAERRKLVEKAQLLCDDAEKKLQAAQERVAGIAQARA